jgi:hypothetical protein
MKIYVSHSSQIDYIKDLYNPLRSSSLSGKHEFLFPHELGLDLFPTRELFLKKGCDLVFAEVSFPSHGQGIELAWAYDAGIRIIFGSKPQAQLSGSLVLLSKEFFTYNNSSELVAQLEKFLL